MGRWKLEGERARRGRGGKRQTEVHRHSDRQTERQTDTRQEEEEMEGQQGREAGTCGRHTAVADAWTQSALLSHCAPLPGQRAHEPGPFHVEQKIQA